MCRTDCIIASVQKDADFTAFCKFIRTGTKKAVIVMDTATFLTGHVFH